MPIVDSAYFSLSHPLSPPFGYIVALYDGDDDAGKGFVAVCDEG